VVWHLLVYRLPSQPSRIRVAVWRELRRLGALPLQQGVVIAPDLEPFGSGLGAVAERIAGDGGTSERFRLAELPAEQEERLVGSWNALRGQEYDEIVEECRTKFLREIEFELFRGNLTVGEAEEIEADLDKIRRWMARVHARDCFASPARARAEQAIAECEQRLAGFVERVYEAELAEGPSTAAPLDIRRTTFGRGDDEGA